MGRTGQHDGQHTGQTLRSAQNRMGLILHVSKQKPREDQVYLQTVTPALGGQDRMVWTRGVHVGGQERPKNGCSLLLPCAPVLCQAVCVSGA